MHMLPVCFFRFLFALLVVSTSTFPVSGRSVSVCQFSLVLCLARASLGQTVTPIVGRDCPPDKAPFKALHFSDTTGVGWSGETAHHELKGDSFSGSGTYTGRAGDSPQHLFACRGVGRQECYCCLGQLDDFFCLYRLSEYFFHVTCDRVCMSFNFPCSVFVCCPVFFLPVCFLLWPFSLMCLCVVFAVFSFHVKYGDRVHWCMRTRCQGVEVVC